MRKVKLIKMLGKTKDVILEHPTLNCKNTSALSQILRFRRSNQRALEVRNYAMNFANSVYIEYNEED